MIVKEFYRCLYRYKIVVMDKWPDLNAYSQLIGRFNAKRFAGQHPDTIRCMNWRCERQEDETFKSVLEFGSGDPFLRVLHSEGSNAAVFFRVYDAIDFRQFFRSLPKPIDVSELDFERIR